MERVVVEVPINNGFSLAGPSTIPRKRQVRFSARHDIILLREVIARNPYASKEPGRIWARVGEIITAALQDENFEVDARRCRERTVLLLDYYKKQDFPSLRRFGTERLYAQKEDLLHEVLELEAEKGLLAGGENTKYQDDELRKRAIEELALPEQDKPNITIAQIHTAVEPEEDREVMAELSAAPTAKRPCQCCCQTYSEILSFLEKRSEAEQRLREEELALRREELEIQRSKIALERERLGAERKERERRFELESQERQVILDLLKEKVLKVIASLTALTNYSCLAVGLSYGYKTMSVSKSGYRVFSANSTTACTELAKKITERLGVELGKSVVYQEPNRETRVDVKESVRGQDIFIIQTIPRDVNTAIMELLVMAYALKTSCAQNIIGVIPYFPYSKQCKMRKRGSIVCKLLASMLAKAGLTHIITMDLHQKEIQGFFNFPVDNLRASPFLIQYIQEEIPDYRNAIIVAKSPSAAKRAQSYAERLRLGLAVMHGEAHHSELDMVDGRHSPPFSPPSCRTTPGHTGLELPCTRHHAPFPGIELPMMMAKEKPPITVVGDVGGRIAIIVDDIIDDVEDFVAAAEILKERGAYKIYIMATHGLLSGDAPRLIEESAIDEVVVTNTVPHEVQKLQCPKIKTVDVSMILAEAIRRIHNGESMAYLFRNIAVDD